MTTQEYPLRLVGDRVFLDIKAFPSAPRTEFKGIQAGRLRIRIACVAEDGKANLELRSALAKALSCPKNDIELVSGTKSHLKTLSFPLSLQNSLKDFISLQMTT